MCELQAQMAEAASRLARIRKIRKKTKERGSELLRRGLQELDAEDDVLPALDAHEYWVADDLQSLGVPNDPDWTSFGLGEEFAGLGPIVPPEPSGGTVEAENRSASGA